MFAYRHGRRLLPRMLTVIPRLVDVQNQCARNIGTSKDANSRETRNNDPQIEPALKGLRVLDLTRVLAGPYCTMILGDMGADVIKVERPGLGDDTRTWGPPFVGKESSYFLCVNRNKKSIAIDMKKPEGVHLIKQLAAASDILVENYIPGKLSEMGLGYPELSAEFPHLIYCSITGYGQTGTYASRPGYDVIVSGTGGLMHITGPEGGEPCKVGVAITDLSTGLYAVGAILASVIARQKSGRGQHIDCNLLSTNVASLANIASNYLNNGIEAERRGTTHPSIVPYQSFETSDGYLLVGAGNNSQFVTLVRAIGFPDLSKDERYVSNSLRVKNRVDLINFLKDVFLEKPTAHWLEMFEGCGFPYGPINNMSQVFSDPQVQHNGLIQETHHPVTGRIRVAGPAVRFSETKTVEPVSPPPTLGEHTDEVLGAVLGLTDKDILSLHKKGIVE